MFSKLKHIPFWLFLFLIGLALAVTGFVGFAKSQSLYAVYVDDGGSTPVAYAVEGNFETVGDVLAAVGVSQLPDDLIEPAVSAPITPERAIQIKRAKKVVVKTEAWERAYMTHQTTLGSFLAETNILIQRTDVVQADKAVVSYQELNGAPLPDLLEISRLMTVTIMDDGERIELTTEAQTVGEALEEAGVRVFAADGVVPVMGSWLSDGLEIVVERSKPLEIAVDGRVIKTRSYHERSIDVLAEAGIGLLGLDYVRPDPTVSLKAGDVIEVIRVREDFEFEDTVLPFEVVWQASSQFEIDTSGVLVGGQTGIERTRVRVRYENGNEVSRTVDGTWVAKEPVDQVNGFGTNIVIRTVETPQGTLEYWRKVRMRVTSYTAATSGKTRDHPAYGITASGVLAGYGVVAVDKKVVPFRTEVYVPDYGVGFAGDTGGGIIGRWIDLGYDEDSLVWWAGYTDVYYLTPVPDASRINFLIPNYLP